jgi:P-type Cu+ transporter
MTETTTTVAPRATTLSAPDITCGGCANAIRRAVGALGGVEDVAVDIAAKTVTVRHGEGMGEATLLDALDRAGFPATVQETGLESGGESVGASCSCCRS